MCGGALALAILGGWKLMLFGGLVAMSQCSPQTQTPYT